MTFFHNIATHRNCLHVIPPVPQWTGNAQLTRMHHSNLSVLSGFHRAIVLLEPTREIDSP